jgi:hypothetical protein
MSRAAIFIAAGIVLAAGASAKVTPQTHPATGVETSHSATRPLATAGDRILAASFSHIDGERLEESSDAVEALVASAPTSVASPEVTTATGPALALSSPPEASRAASVAPKTCPATWFCFPRVGVAGPIVPYADCSGSSDVGSAIRSFNCLGKGYLVGHAYTQFGLIRQWAVGDIVFAYGVRYSVSGAITQSACSAPVLPLAPLSLQTSLTSGACGAVLVVQAR